jgi:hypothetical protein
LRDVLVVGSIPSKRTLLSCDPALSFVAQTFFLRAFKGA